MKHIIALSLIPLLSACSDPGAQIAAPDYATAALDLSSPEGTAYSMMVAMYRGDAAMIDRVFQDRGDLSRVKADGTTEYGGRERWQDWVGTLKTGRAHEELFGIEVKQYGNLASVWAPFVIRFDGKIVGCGINQLSMAKSNGEWRIVSGMDAQEPNEQCATFKTDYRAGTRK